MTASDSDLELLEEHLDGALDDSASALLHSRLATEAQLSAALSELTAQRVVRRALWNSIEPSAASADHLLWRVRGAMLDQKMLDQEQKPSRSAWSSWRIASFSSAAAACLILGFVAGRVGPRGASLSQPSPIAASGGADNGTLALNLKPSEQDKLDRDKFQQIGTTPQVLVPISNEYGQVVRWQPFENAEQAKNFEEDLHRAQGGGMNPGLAVPPKLASQEHF